MDVDGRAASHVVAGLTQTERSAFAPLGQIKQATKIAAGLKQPRHGWRKVVAVVGLVVIAAATAAVIVAGLFAQKG